MSPDPRTIIHLSHSKGTESSPRLTIETDGIKETDGRRQFLKNTGSVLVWHCDMWQSPLRLGLSCINIVSTDRHWTNNCINTIKMLTSPNLGIDQGVSSIWLVKGRNLIIQLAQCDPQLTCSICMCKEICIIWNEYGQAWEPRHPALSSIGQCLHSFMWSISIQFSQWIMNWRMFTHVNVGTC